MATSPQHYEALESNQCHYRGRGPKVNVAKTKSMVCGDAIKKYEPKHLLTLGKKQLGYAVCKEMSLGDESREQKHHALKQKMLVKLSLTSAA